MHFIWKFIAPAIR